VLLGRYTDGAMVAAGLEDGVVLEVGGQGEGDLLAALADRPTF
jgi:hypothetical protein